MATVAIITARGGSKRIPRKNVKPFLGVPIIRYSICAAAEAGCFDEVMVSTDDAEIADVARAAGAAVPFFRSARASDDHATTADALVEVLAEYAARGRQFDLGCCLYPTAPFVTGEALRAGARLLAEDPDLQTVVPVVRFGYPIQRSFRIENNRLQLMWPEHVSTRSQDLPPAYHDVGQFYWFRVAEFLRTRRLFAERTAPIVLPEWAAQDIDTEDDWVLAETKYEVLRRRHAVRPAT
jgi:N-acylneuraminate cytidylyltransferase